jgi:energy-coupling factor transporter ATP-binding protein EcfA2
LSNLDADLRVRMRHELASLHKRLGATMIYVTHDQVEAMTLADRIVVMNAGRIEQVGTPLDLYERPANRFVAGFIGSPAMNFLPGRVEAAGQGRARVRLALGPCLEVALAAPVEAGTAVTLGVRPEHLRLGAAGDAPTHVGRAFVVEMLGSDTFVHLREEGGDIVVRDSEARRMRTGDAVTVDAFPRRRQNGHDGAANALDSGPDRAIDRREKESFFSCHLKEKFFKPCRTMVRPRRSTSSRSWSRRRARPTAPWPACRNGSSPTRTVRRACRSPAWRSRPG